MRRVWILLCVGWWAVWTGGCSNHGTPTANREQPLAGAKRLMDSTGSVGEHLSADTVVERRAADNVERFAEKSTESVAPPERPGDERESDRARRVKRAREIQSGTLTAGSFDDNERFEEFCEFVSLTMQQDHRELFPRFPVSDRVLICVVNEQGDAIGGARIVVRAVPGQSHSPFERGEHATVPYECVTGSDGRAAFLPALAGFAGVRDFELTILPREQGAPVTATFRRDQSPWNLTLAAPAILPNRLDLALVVDTTGSMGDELEYLKVEMDSIAAEVHRLFPGVHQRYALIVYRDRNDEYVTRTFDFTSSLDDFRSTLAGQFATGGGDYPEAVHTALEEASRLSWREGETARVLFLVGDAPPHDAKIRATLDAVTSLQDKQVRVFPVAASGTNFKAEFVMRAAAFLTLGQYLFLTDHSGVGNPHAEPHVSAYDVEPLNRLMVRMIASELSGRRIPARAILDRVGVPAGSIENRSLSDSARSQRIHTAMPKRLEAASFPPRWLVLVLAILGWFAMESLLESLQRKRCGNRAEEDI